MMISRICRSVTPRCNGLRGRRWTSTTSFTDPEESCVSSNNSNNNHNVVDSSTLSKHMADKFAIGVSITKSATVPASTTIFKVNHNNNNHQENDKSRCPQPVPTGPQRNEQVKTAACGDVSSTVEDKADDMEQEEMFVDADESLGMKEREWGGPRRGGRFPEPTRFGDWERKGRCTDF